MVQLRDTTSAPSSSSLFKASGIGTPSKVFPVSPKGQILITDVKPVVKSLGKNSIDFSLFNIL